MSNQLQSHRGLLKWRNFKEGESRFVARPKQHLQKMLVEWRKKTGFTFIITKIGDRLCRIERVK